jgi:hypothetical protein
VNIVQTKKQAQAIAEDGYDHCEQPAPVLRFEPKQSISATTAGPIDETIRIRDRHQFEIKLHYPIGRKSATAAYNLESYIFVPRSLEIDRSNYSKTKFYDDLQTHIRFKTPTLSLTSITKGPDSPLIKLESSTLSLQDQGNEANVAAFEYRLKLFCCILQCSLRDQIAFIKDAKETDKRGHLVRQYIKATTEVINAYRALRSNIALPMIASRACAVYAYGDEYISLLIERNGYDLLEHIKRCDHTELRTSKRRILELISNEVRYRKNRQFPSIASDKNDNELLIYRRNVLKKYMHKVLFLATRTRDEGKVIEHGLFGVAAGISMLFATIVLFLSQSIFGPLTLQVFLALVIGYMFKDRIKELLRVYFSKKVSGLLFDHRTRIYSSPHNPIGHCRESFDFVEEDKVPARIMKIRNRDPITEIANDWVSENVLRYRKRIKLSSRAITAAYRDIDTNGITDIMRFNVAEFTRRMGHPRKELFVLDKGDYRKVKAERVYHLNMILRYGGDDCERYEHFRIVLNRRKIKRIETVSVEGD